MMTTNYILKPVVTEKSVASGQDNKFTFIVRKDANKVAISQQLTALYGVAPEKVNIQTMPAKKRSFGRKEMTKRAAHKRAIVSFPKDANIDIFKPKTTPKKK